MFDKPKRNFAIIVILLLIIFVLTIFLFIYQKQQRAPSELKKALSEKISRYCLAQGGSIDVRSDGKDGKFIVCILKDGTECDAEKYFYGQCEPKPIGEVKSVEDTTKAWGNLRFTIPEDWTLEVNGDKSLILGIPKITNITLEVDDLQMLDILESSFVIEEKIEVRVGDLVGEVWTGNTLRSKNDRFKALILNTGREIYFLRANMFGSIYLDEIIKTLSFDPNIAGFRGDYCGSCSSGLSCQGGECE